jgi:hypothetical protein
MPMRISIRYLVLITCLASFASIAASIVVGSQMASTQPPTPELAALRAQIETMREYHDRFIAIVLWSLGIVFAIALGLAAFSWFTNKTTYERDREALRTDRDALRQELRALIADELRGAVQQVTAALAERQVAIQKAVETAVSSKLENVEKRLTNTVEAVIELQDDAIKLEAEQAVREKSHSWALWRYADYLAAAMKHGADRHEINNILDPIRTILETPNLTLDTDVTTKLVDTLKRVPERHSATVEKILERVKAAHT